MRPPPNPLVARELRRHLRVPRCAVPLAGSVGDVFFHANLRKLALLRRQLDKKALNLRRGSPAG